MSIQDYASTRESFLRGELSPEQWVSYNNNLLNAPAPELITKTNLVSLSSAVAGSFTTSLTGLSSVLTASLTSLSSTVFGSFITSLTSLSSTVFGSFTTSLTSLSSTVFGSFTTSLTGLSSVLAVSLTTSLTSLSSSLEGSFTTSLTSLSSSLAASLVATSSEINDRVVVTKLPQHQRADTLLRQWVITSNGDIITWGRANNGASGSYYTDDRTIQQMRPYFDVPIPSGVTVVDIASTTYYTLVLLSNGWVYSTGYNGYGQLGQGDTTYRYIFTRIPYFITNNISISKIVTGGSRHGYATTGFIDSNGDVYMCGYNGHGGCGNGNTGTDVNTPTKVAGLTNVVELAISDTYVARVLALKTNGDLWAWGYNGSSALLGLPTIGVYNTPQLIASSVSKFDITTGGYDPGYYEGMVIILKTNGDVFTAGYNGYGSLGHGDTTNRNTFTKISTLSNIVDVGCGGGQWPTCYAVSADRKLYTWGYNAYYTVGNNTTTHVSSPYEVKMWKQSLTQAPPFVGKEFVVFQTPSSHSYNTICVIDSDGRIFVCGANQGISGGTTDAIQVFTEIVPTLGQPGEKAVSGIFYLADSDIVLTILTNKGNVYSVGRNNWGACNVGLDDNSPTYRFTFNRQRLYV